VRRPPPQAAAHMSRAGSEMHDMGSGSTRGSDAASEQRQRLLAPTRSLSAGALFSGALSARAAAVPERRKGSLQYPAGLAGIILGVAACGYLSG